MVRQSQSEPIELRVTVEVSQPQIGGGRIHLSETMQLPKRMTLLQAAAVLTAVHNALMDLDL